MRSLFLAASAVAATMFLPAAAFAGAAAPVSNLRAALGEYPVAEKVACWRYGRYGWRVYPGCYPAPAYVAPPVYVAPSVYVAPPVYVAPVPRRRCWTNGRWVVC
ncbi:hypothetical protein [Pseudorhodoplanes sp.]|uniref:hypothetical protein n=1 Tax=Pseudorhodoplanes sp. TaxID=1934341 RepID=UPI003919E4FF